MCKAFLLLLVWKKYLDIADIKALMILTFGVMMSVVIRQIVPKKQAVPEVYLTYFDSLDRVDKLETTQAYWKSEKKRTRTIKPRLAASLKRFDINYASARDLYAMGLSSEFVGKWFAAKSQFGFVKSIGEFKALGVCNDSLINLLTPYLDWSRYSNPTDRAELLVKVNLNTADSSMLTQLQGVGKVLASRIVRYRNRLGGFVSEKQLLEVYGIDSSVFSKNQSRIDCTGEVVKIDLNNVTENELSRHPYISWSQAKLIVRYREQHGNFQYVHQLYALHGADSNMIHRLKPYLEIIDD